MAKWFNLPRLSGKTTGLILRAFELQHKYEDVCLRKQLMDSDEELPPLPMIVTPNSLSKNLINKTIESVTGHKNTICVVTPDELLNRIGYSTKYKLLIDEADKSIESLFNIMGYNLDTCVFTLTDNE